MTVTGGQGQRGSYVLRIEVHEDVEIVFGGFQKGRSILLPTGEYSYVGSALGGTGAAALGRRLIRHASRTGRKPPHPIRAAMLEAFRAVGMGDDDRMPGRGKTLRWNVDHLLDREEVELAAVIAARSPERLEPRWARLLEADPHTHVVAKGLGANDAPGHTHLLRVEADEGWWAGLPGRLFAVTQSTGG